MIVQCVGCLSCTICYVCCGCWLRWLFRRDNEGVTYSDLFLGFVTRANLHLTLHVPPGVEDAYGVCVNVFSPMGFRYLENVGFDSCTFSTPTTRCCLNAPIASGESVSGWGLWQGCPWAGVTMGAASCCRSLFVWSLSSRLPMYPTPQLLRCKDRSQWGTTPWTPTKQTMAFGLCGGWCLLPTRPSQCECMQGGSGLDKRVS